MSIRLFYGMWPQYDRRLREVIGAMTGEQLAIRPSPEGWPIWATVGHTAGGRVYWLCFILGEPGGDETPFAGGDEGWEDDLDHPRSAAELVMALETTFRVIDRCLDNWTPAMLEDRIERKYGDHVQVHTRASIVQRIFSPRPTTAVSYRGPWASPACPRSTSGARTERRQRAPTSRRPMVFLTQQTARNGPESISSGPNPMALPVNLSRHERGPGQVLLAPPAETGRRPHQPRICSLEKTNGRVAGTASGQGRRGTAPTTRRSDPHA